MSTKPEGQLSHELYVVLFSSGQRMLLDELSKLVKEEDQEVVKDALSKLRVDLDAQNAPVMLLQDGDEYKLAVRSKFMALVQKVVKQTELPKSMLETLAVIAYKSPVLQSDVIRIRTNKAYEHLAKLEELGYLSRERHGRTKLCRVSQKFYDYFEISPEELAKKIEKRQIKEAGEAQMKITAIHDTVGELHVYGEATAQTADVHKYESDTKKVEDDLADVLPEDLHEKDSLFESDTIAPIDNDTVQIIDTPKKESSDKHEKIETKEEPINEKIDEAREDQLPDDPEPKHSKKSPTTKKKEGEKEYQPPKVKGGFVKFTQEEKKKIKEEIDDITGSKKD
jgi:segregation and condensation protein B